MSEAYKKLIKTLQTIFEMDKADLDFGIYRIMNQKRDEINRFLENDLLAHVKEAFEDFAEGGKGEIQTELDQLTKTLTDAGMDPEQSPKVRELREKLASSVDVTAIENEVFSHLHTFFSRYYDQGDFISQRRYKKDTYAIPYEGEEVKLYWANHDQYYIKSSEHLRDYAFVIKDGDKTVRIKLVEADTEKDNVKAESGKERRFVLDAENPLSIENGELHIHFRYIPAGKKKQEALNKEAVETIFQQGGFDEWLTLLKQKAPTEKNPNRTLLEKHLNDYTARNTFDYFIHKDLGGFLRRELDFYIKNEVLHLDDIDDAAFEVTEQHLRKIKVIRTIAFKIIRMLAQLEDFQKKLWLKKKFVVETNYCMTLDRIPEELYGEIASNTAQHEEWVKLGFITEDTEITEEYLKENPFLVLDTKFFDEAFKDRLLSSIESLDEQCDGLMFCSENYQALSLLFKSYRNKIDAIYIDPPYNAPASEVLYKNEYKHSAWIALMENRISLSKKLLNDKAPYAVAIDDYEVINLGKILDQTFIGFDRNIVVVNHHPQGGMSKNVTRTHEYMIILTPQGVDILRGRKKDGGIEYRSFMLSGPGENKSRTGRPNSFYAVIINKEGEIVGFEPPPTEKSYPTTPTNDGHIRIYPINKAGEEKVWARSYSSAYRCLEKGEIVLRNGKLKLAIETTGKRHSVMSNWVDSRYNAGPHGTGLLANILCSRDLFAYPKSIYTVQDAVESMTWPVENPIVLDFFAGSGTTGHAVINLNREDGGKRKYILVEMGEYFDTVIKPRIQKVVYSKDWKDGKPKPDNDGNLNGISHCFKYLRLESYEDTLNNLILKPRTQQQDDMLNNNPSLREDYMLGYWLDVETADSPSLLNIEQFENPFDYKLNIATGSVGATKPTSVDLVETFNYLIGLTVKHIDTVRGFKVITGTNPKDESVLIIWRNLKEKDNAALEEFMEKQAYHPRDTEFDHIYVNGDHTLEDPHSKVKMIEIEFKRLMFDVQDV